MARARRTNREFDCIERGAGFGNWAVDTELRCAPEALSVGKHQGALRELRSGVRRRGNLLSGFARHPSIHEQQPAMPGTSIRPFHFATQGLNFAEGTGRSEADYAHTECSAAIVDAGEEGGGVTRVRQAEYRLEVMTAGFVDPRTKQRGEGRQVAARRDLHHRCCKAVLKSRREVSRSCGIRASAGGSQNDTVIESTAAGLATRNPG